MLTVYSEFDNESSSNRNVTINGCVFVGNTLPSNNNNNNDNDSNKRYSFRKLPRDLMEFSRG